MEQWKYRPAKDLDVSLLARWRSVRRESGLLSFLSRSIWWWGVKAALRIAERIEVSGTEHLPASSPFIIVANHSSHLDALVLATALPPRLRNMAFPIAAGDTFFKTPLAAAWSAQFLNALPMWRHNAGRHALQDLRARLIEEPCGYVLFPEGTRTRTGKMGAFRAGLGMLVAGVHAPVIPCYLRGTFEALPPGRLFPRRTKIEVKIGSPLTFESVPNTREGWTQVSQETEAAVRQLGGLARRQGSAA